MIANGPQRSPIRNDTAGKGPTTQTSPDSPSRASKDSTRPQNDEAHAHDGLGPPHPLDGLLANVKELSEYASLYVQARRDQYTASLRNMMIKAALGILAAVVGITLLIVATAYLLSGIAAGLGQLFGERYALGQFVTGLTVLFVIGAVAFFGMKSLFAGSRKRTLEKYGRRHAEERQQFGHDVTNRAQRVRESD